MLRTNPARRRLISMGVLAVLVLAWMLGGLAARLPDAVVAGPLPAAEVLETGRAGGVPVNRHAGQVPVVTDPGAVRIAITPWMAARFGRQVLSDAEAVLSPPESRLRVRFVVRTMPTRSDFAVTGARLQVGRCGGYHGLAFSELGAADPGQPVVPVASGRVHICGATFRLGHDAQVALLVHETAHLLGLGHVCSSHGCRQGDPPGCTHLMAGRWWHDCPGPIDLTSLDDALVALYPRG